MCIHVNDLEHFAHFPNRPNALNTLRQEQFNLLVYGSARPYFKQKQKNNITKFWPAGFFQNVLISAF